MELRRLAVADAERYRALMLDGYRLHPDAFTASVAEREPLPLAWWEARVASGDDVDQLVIGAFDDDRLIGVAGLRFEERPKTRHKAWLVGMYVESSSTRRGIGSALVRAVLDAARARRGVRIVQLTVSEGNDAARVLYGRCGFIPFGLEPMAIVGEREDFVAKLYMWIDLAAGRDG